jgi:hypothetical protein
MLEAALKYAALGWLVLPIFGIDPVTLRCTCGDADRCTGSGKHPRTRFGLKEASTDPEQIKAWWASWPSSNVGVRTGPESGLCVFDYDGEAGVALADSIRTPPTPWAITGSGGRHAFFVMPSHSVSSRVRVRPGLDIRATNAYVVVPPSLHKSGKRYSWCEALSPWDTDPAPVTDELLPLIEPIKLAPGAVEIFEDRGPADALTVVRAKAYLAKVPLAISGQGGSGDTFRAALFATRGFGLSKSQALEIMRGYSDRCTPPWSEKELLHKIDDAYKSTRVPDRFIVDRVSDGDGDGGGREPWRLTIDNRTSQGVLLPVLSQRNAAIFLENEPGYAGRIGYDEFSRRVTLTEGSAVRPWRNSDLLVVVDWLQARGRQLYVGKDVAQDAVDFVAHRNPYHPVRDYLESLPPWDGTPRVDTWLINNAGAKDDQYVRAVSGKWLIGAVARAMRPGCQADAVLILEGPQGVGKSSAIDAMGSPWASTLATSTLHGKEAAEQLSGKWLVEIAELSSVSRSETEAVKDFLTRTNDYFRAAYARVAEDNLRQCVFAGSTNSSEYLKDETGNRRFWPVRIGQVDVKRLRSERDQIWSEATARFLAGEPWHLSRELEVLASEEQDARRIADSWDETVGIFLEKKTAAMGAERASVAVGEILLDCFGLPLERHDQLSQNRIGRILIARHWTRFQQRQEGGARAWRYRPGVAP